MIETIARALYEQDSEGKYLPWEEIDQRVYMNLIGNIVDLFIENGYLILPNPYHVFWGPNPSKKGEGV